MEDNYVLQCNPTNDKHDDKNKEMMIIDKSDSKKQTGETSNKLDNISKIVIQIIMGILLILILYFSFKTTYKFIFIEKKHKYG